MRKSTRIAATVASAGLIAAAMAAPVSAAPSNKGTTTVAPSDVTVSVLKGVLKPGSLGDSGAMFGIVGNPSSGVIKHVGGLAVNGTAGILGDPYLELRNFWIDTNTSVVSGDVENFGRAPLFNVDLKTGVLTFTLTASLAIVGSDGIAGDVAGTATVNVK
jgi:hypothetical protein